MSHFDLGRRRVMQAVGAGLLLPGLAPAVIASVKDRPQLTDGVQSGDLQGDRAMIWSRSDRPAKMVVEWDTRSVFSNPRRFVSPLADSRTDFTARVELTGRPRCVRHAARPPAGHRQCPVRGHGAAGRRTARSHPSASCHSALDHRAAAAAARSHPRCRSPRRPEHHRQADRVYRLCASESGAG